MKIRHFVPYCQFRKKFLQNNLKQISALCPKADFGNIAVHPQIIEVNARLLDASYSNFRVLENLQKSPSTKKCRKSVAYYLSGPFSLYIKTEIMQL